MFYDTLLTFEQEMEYIWLRKLLRLPPILYILTRYLTGTVYLWHFISTQLPSSSLKVCIMTLLR